jgi:phenylalanyl-tRNA synthetase beta chain
MRISYDWLKEYIDHSLEYEELIRTLTMIGLESEPGEKMECEFDGVIVGKIAELVKRDKGHIVTVDIGSSEHPKVYCTALNVEIGMLVPYAPPGSSVKAGKVEKKEFGDFVSIGVICSSEELGIGRDSPGVLPLGKPLKVGDDLKQYLFSDLPIEIELVSNRGDLYSFMGIARELAVHLKTKSVELPALKADKSVTKHKDMGIEILDPDKCPLYTYRMFDDFKVLDSPAPLLRKLIALGLKPINNIVDLTNLVLYEIGQPLHPFDRKLLQGKKIIIRGAEQNEKFKTLDDTERILDNADLLIADETGGIALGGVMGGLLSEINWNTNRVLLESAYFEKVGIRRTSHRHALRTDSSIRFERGVDPRTVVMASDRVAWYVNELGIGKVADVLVYSGTLKYPHRKISCRLPRIESCLGYEIPLDEISRILTGLGFGVKEKGKSKIDLEIPTYRADIEIEEDVAEEVARHHGYNEIPSTLPKIDMGRDLLHDYDRLKISMRKLLAGWGLHEVVSFALGGKDELGRTHFLRQDVQRVDIVNPMTQDHTSLRTNLEETMLNTLANNYKKQSGLRNIFEIGRAYWKTGSKFHEKDELCIMLSVEGTGKSSKTLEQDLFLTVKGLVVEILEHLKIRNYTLVMPDKMDNLSELSGDAFMSILTDGKPWGYIQLIPETEMKRRDIALIVASATLDWESLLDMHTQSRHDIKLESLPKYPASKRDLALVVPENVRYEDVETTIRESGGKLLTDLNLFDIYTGKQVESGCISMALNLTFQDKERTLTDEIVDSQIETILKTLEERLGIRLRDK